MAINELNGTPARILTAEEAHALSRAVAKLDISNPPPVVGSSKILAALSDEISGRLHEHGVCVLEGLEAADNETAFALMALVGRPGADADEEDAGPLVMDLRPLLKDVAATTTSYYTWKAFDFHTDLAYVDVPPDYVAVLCVQPDPEGDGFSLFSDIVACLQTMQLKDIATLQKPFFNIGAPPGCRTSQRNVPLLRKDDNGRWRVRVRFDRLLADSSEAKDALGALYNACERHRAAILIPKFAAYICDYSRVMHGRTPFSFRGDGTERHLKRIYGMRR